MTTPTLYDELDAIIDKIEKESAYHQSPILRSITNDLRDIRDRLHDEIEEVTVVVNNEKVVSDVLVNGKQKTYCVVPKDQLPKYLKDRGLNKECMMPPSSR